MKDSFLYVIVWDGGFGGNLLSLSDSLVSERCGKRSFCLMMMLMMMVIIMMMMMIKLILKKDQNKGSHSKGTLLKVEGFFSVYFTSLSSFCHGFFCY